MTDEEYFIAKLEELIEIKSEPSPRQLYLDNLREELAKLLNQLTSK
jgi:hypothetical protein